MSNEYRDWILDIEQSALIIIAHREVDPSYTLFTREEDDEVLDFYKEFKQNGTL